METICKYTHYTALYTELAYSLLVELTFRCAPSSAMCNPHATNYGVLESHTLAAQVSSS